MSRERRPARVFGDRVGAIRVSGFSLLRAKGGDECSRGRMPSTVPRCLASDQMNAVLITYVLLWSGPTAYVSRVCVDYPQQRPSALELELARIERQSHTHTEA